MSDIDEQIRRALTTEDQKAIDEINESAGLFELIGLSVTGKQAWFSYYMYFMGLVVMAAFVYFTMQYLEASDLKSSLNWALLILGCLFMLTIIKVLGWQQIHKAEMMREIKRLEMRIMLVAEKNQK